MRRLIIAACVVLGSLLSFAESRADTKTPAAAPTTRPAAKPLSENVNKGLAFLVKTQMSNGAWAQGEESQEMGRGMDNIKGSPNVADTCMATMALMRSGSSPRNGEYQTNILMAVDFVCSEIELSGEKDLYITRTRGTRTQLKLGTYIDTFMAAQLLTEAQDKMPDGPSTHRVSAALAKVLKKIELNQREDGRWANEGWAPTLAQAQAAKAINHAAQKGNTVDPKVLAKTEDVARKEYAMASARPASPAAGERVAMGGFGGASMRAGSSGGGVGGYGGVGSGDAGVELYSRGSQVAAMQASANTNAALRTRYLAIANAPTTRPADRQNAVAMLKRFDANDADLLKAQNDLVGKLGDRRFMAGFGSNGGEEFLSYLNIGESLYQRGGDGWIKWDNNITENLNRVQNGDGSWSGHHCITGRTFCSSAALMVLMIDRAPTPGPVIDRNKTR